VRVLLRGGRREAEPGVLPLADGEGDSLPFMCSSEGDVEEAGVKVISDCMGSMVVGPMLPMCSSLMVFIIGNIVLDERENVRQRSVWL